MPLRFRHTFVILVAATVLLLPPAAGAQLPPLDPIMDSDAYALYGDLLPALWASRSKDTVLIREETQFYQCRGNLKMPDADWQSAWDNYASENSRSRRLLYMFPTLTSYLLISTAEVQAEAARLTALYPGLWQHRQGQTDYAAVSAVGFDRTKTRAVLYLSVGNSGDVALVEKRDGHWSAARVPGAVTCGWIA